MIGRKLCIFLLIASQAAAQTAVEAPRFASYEEVFRFIASRSDLETVDDTSVFKLASDSCVDYVRARKEDWYLVVRADYLVDHISAIRGVQGNGPFYVFREVDGAFRFLGVMFGNAYTQTSVNGEVGFDVRSHAGGGRPTTGALRRSRRRAGPTGTELAVFLRTASSIAAAWFLSLGFDVFLHGGLLARST